MAEKKNGQVAAAKTNGNGKAEVQVQVQGIETLRSKVEALLKGGSEEESKVRVELQKVEEEIAKLQERRAELRKRLTELRLQHRANPEVRAAMDAVQALRILGVDLGIAVPEGNGTRAPKAKNGNGNGSVRSLRLKVNGVLQEDNPARTLWYNTKGCNGTGKEGRLTVPDLMGLVEKAGAKYTDGGWKVELPNKKVLEGVFVQG